MQDNALMELNETSLIQEVMLSTVLCTFCTPPPADLKAHSLVLRVSKERQRKYFSLQLAFLSTIRLVDGRKHTGGC